MSDPIAAANSVAASAVAATVNQTQAQAASYLNTLLASLTVQVLIPMVMFMVMLVIVWYLLAKAQSKSDFNIEKIFMDDNAKPSVLPVVTLLSFCVSTWYLASELLAGKASSQDFLYFLMTWSGTVAVIEFAKRWDGHLPGTKVISPTNVDVTQNPPVSAPPAV